MQHPGWFTPGKKKVFNCIGSWVDPRAGLDVCEKSRPPPGIDSRTNNVHVSCSIWYGILRKVDHLKDSNVDGRIILKRIFEKLDRSGSGQGQMAALMNAAMNLESHKIRGITSALNLLASQEGLCPVELHVVRQGYSIHSSNCTIITYTNIQSLIIFLHVSAFIGHIQGSIWQRSSSSSYLCHGCVIAKLKHRC